MSSGYTHCACRDCFETVVSADSDQPEFCSDCEDSGCEHSSECVSGLNDDFDRPSRILVLTNNEIFTIAFVAERGYAMEVWVALQDSNPEACEAAFESRRDTTTSHIFRLSQDQVDEIAFEESGNGGHGFGPVVDHIARKLYALIAG